MWLQIVPPVCSEHVRWKFKPEHQMGQFLQLQNKTSASESVYEDTDSTSMVKTIESFTDFSRLFH